MRAFCLDLKALVLAGALTLELCFAISAQQPIPSNQSALSLEAQLQSGALEQWSRLALAQGDAKRGALIFFRPALACAGCHAVGDQQAQRLGPDLTRWDSKPSDEHLVESILFPSKQMREGFQAVTVQTADGRALVGLLAEKNDQGIKLRDPAAAGMLVSIPHEDVEAVRLNPVSLMPSGLVQQLADRQAFVDLIRYLIEIRDGGAERARQLQPSEADLASLLPEYERHLDHAALIGSWDQERGEAIYRRVCANCHGTHDAPGSLPNSLRFAAGKFKNGSDPWSMYKTLTHGFGFMMPQAWMVPQQKYDVIHYIREAYLQTHNPSQYTRLDKTYLDGLPKGDTMGPAPSKIEPWSAMDYGPSLAHTYELPAAQPHFAYKGIAIRLDPGSGGVSRGKEWCIFDLDTLRLAGAWHAADESTNRFIDWRGIQFNGEHKIHPHVVGDLRFSNHTGPGWANPVNNSLADDQRVLGRDDRRYGPLPREWAQYYGLYHYGQQVILSYRIGSTDVLESPMQIAQPGGREQPWIARTLNIGARKQDLLLRVADAPDGATKSGWLPEAAQRNIRRWVAPTPDEGATPAASQPARFSGDCYVEITDAAQLDMVAQDFTIAARIKTNSGGTIFALTEANSPWAPNGQTWFVRNGQLCFDIGWVGAITSKGKVDDGLWHDVAVTWEAADKQLQLWIDGRPAGKGALSSKARLKKPVARIGFTAANFPTPRSYFDGELQDVRFYQSVLSREMLKRGGQPEPSGALKGRWLQDGLLGETVADASKHQLNGRLVRSSSAPASKPNLYAAGFLPADAPVEWRYEAGQLCLKIPAGDQPLRLGLWINNDSQAQSPPDYAPQQMDLNAWTKGGLPRWPERVTTRVQPGTNEGAFAADVLSLPDANPWLAQVRPTGIDFMSDGRFAVCTWDGDVWLVEMATVGEEMRWQRIASGLFQPLGIKVLKDKIHVLCRDQLAVLHDLNGDGETDFYECLNQDHQVTEHFHEFAMGLQVDAQGNFYYAKSGRHALAAVVPQHGTLLKVMPDGSRTEILATGFRAANGVCLNPDGSFVVTDQEGFWNPKNRINWVTYAAGTKPKFYGNMFGYHDVTDESDSAMEPPLCWITNAMDRSPAELLWVDSSKWGPLNGRLLNLSYGYGKVFLVPHEQVGERMQGGLIELPIAPFPTGVMRGRFSAVDGQLYLCGMFAWAGNATQPGGFYRLRATGRDPHLPIELNAIEGGLKLTFTNSVLETSVTPEHFQIHTWSLKRSAKYGSEHYDDQPLKITACTLSADGKTVELQIPDIKPTWCMEIQYQLQDQTGKSFSGKIHNTIHALSKNVSVSN